MDNIAQDIDALEKVLSFLPMPSLFWLSYLSRRWENFWNSTPRVDFSQTNIVESPQLIACIDKALDNRERSILEFLVHVECNLCLMFKIYSWIDYVVRQEVEGLCWI